MVPKPEIEGGIKSMETAFAIVETIHKRGQVRLTEIADVVGIANSTAFDHLLTLERHGYVIREDENYRLGLKFLDHGMRARDHYRTLTETAEPVLEQLVADTDETVNLVVEERSQAVYLIRLTGDRGVPTNSWVGKRKPIHTISAGKSILAHLSEERVDEIVGADELKTVTGNTIDSRAELERELDEIREKGVAFNDRESHESIRAVGVPIVLKGTVIGAVSVAGPAKRLRGAYFREEIPELLQGAANEIELKLTYQ